MQLPRVTLSMRWAGAGRLQLAAVVVFAQQPKLPSDKRSPESSINCCRSDGGGGQEAFCQRASHHARGPLDVQLPALDHMYVVYLGSDILQAELIDSVVPVLGAHLVGVCTKVGKNCQVLQNGVA